MNTPSHNEELLTLIRETFHDVLLGEGISLNQALVIDNYGSDEEQQAVRSQDEQHDWQKLINTPEIVSLLSNAISFFDERGMLFHIPVCLSLMTLSPESNQTLVHAFGPYHFKAHNLLNDKQRQCVNVVLEHVGQVTRASGWSLISVDVLRYWNLNTSHEARLEEYIKKGTALGYIVTEVQNTISIDYYPKE